VERFISGQGARGATDREVQAALRIRVSTEVPRRRELVLEGKVEDSGRRRSCQGVKSTVWVIREGGGNGGGQMGRRPNWKGYFLDINQRVNQALNQIRRAEASGEMSTEVKERLEEILRPNKKGKVKNAKA
jgi:hypothetical protein